MKTDYTAQMQSYKKCCALDLRCVDRSLPCFICITVVASIRAAVQLVLSVLLLSVSFNLKCLMRYCYKFVSWYGMVSECTLVSLYTFVWHIISKMFVRL